MLINDINKPKYVPTRDGFGEGLLELGKQDEKTVVVCADLSESTRVEKFGATFPHRFFEVGVAEQNMVGIACGMALEGLSAWTASYATFNPGRSWDQIRVSGCYNNINLKIAGHHTGLSVGPDGATHQALEDVALMRVLPHMTVVVPCDAHEARKATITLGMMQGPAYIRLGRAPTPLFTTQDAPFKLGKANVLRDGSDVAIIGAGPILHDALLVANILQKSGISCAVINLHTIKPIDVAMITKYARQCKAIVTVEEHQVNAGIGSAIAEVVVKSFPVPIEMVGMNDSFGESGEPKELLAKYSMDAKAIGRAVAQVLKRKS